MAPDPDDTRQFTSGHNGVHSDNNNGGATTRRHPRWTRQETLILIEAKKAVENRVRRGSRSTSVLWSGQTEPKWDSVSSYCKQHGVNRGPVQCRKRWGNLLCDFKKIKTWESQEKDEGNSFWIMRNEWRKERKLPCYFDREVYDVLDRRMCATAAIPLTIVTVKTEINDIDGDDASAAAEEEKEHEENSEGVLRSDLEQLRRNEIGWRCKMTKPSTETPIKTTATPNPISEQTTRKPENTTCKEFFINCPAGTTREGNAGLYRWMGSAPQKGCKRKWSPSDGVEGTSFEDRLIQVFERNNLMLAAQLEAQNTSNERDRDQRKEDNNNIVNALNKLTDVIVRFADKL